MSLSRLSSVVHPPPKPVGIAPARAWTEAEAKFGTPLPDDIKLLNQMYAIGMFDGLARPRIKISPRSAGRRVFCTWSDPGYVGEDRPPAFAVLQWATSKRRSKRFELQLASFLAR